MTRSTATVSLRAHFARCQPSVKATYAALLRAVRSFGPVEEQPKKTSIHLARRTAFAGVATQKGAVVLTVKAAADVPSPRVRRRERASANRWHLELKLTDPREVDTELIGWLRTAYELSA